MAERFDLKVVAKLYSLPSGFQVPGCIVALLSIAQIAICQDEQARRSDDSVAIAMEPPVVQWTAGRDAMNFRYDFLNHVKEDIEIARIPLSELEALK